MMFTRLRELLTRWQSKRLGDSSDPFDGYTDYAPIPELPESERADPLGIHAPQRPAYRLWCVTAAAETVISKHGCMKTARFAQEYYVMHETVNNRWEEIDVDCVDPFAVMLLKETKRMDFTIVGGTDGESVQGLAQRKPSWPYGQKPIDQEPLF